ncbi:6947_t:CDS:2, partial [Cetraspora pellucida]
NILPKAKINKPRITEPSFGRRDGRYLTRTNRTVYFGTKVTPEFDEAIRRLAHEQDKLITEMLEDFLAAYLEKKSSSIKKKSTNDSWYNLLPTIIPIDNQEIAKKLKAEEAGEILRVIEEKRKKEEKVVRKKSARIKDIKTNLKKYQLKTEKLTPQDIEKFDKEEKKKKKTKPTKIKERDLDQENQEPEELTPKFKKKRK